MKTSAETGGVGDTKKESVSAETQVSAAAARPEAQRTKEPWKWSEHGACWLEGADGSTILHVDPDSSDVPGPADRALIEAAADLLKALRDLHNECEAAQGPELRSDPVWGPLMKAAEDAIAKAEGA